MAKPNVSGNVRCGSCEKVRRTGDFTVYAYVNRYARKDGTVKEYGGIRLATYCKSCMKARMDAWRDANIERFRSYQRQYQAKARAVRKCAIMGGNDTATARLPVPRPVPRALRD